MFEKVPYWYYYSTAYFDDEDLTVDKKVKDLDVLQEVIDADFVMLSYSTVGLYQMSNGFSSQLLHKIYYDEGETGPVDFDSIPAKRSKAFLRYTEQKQQNALE